MSGNLPNPFVSDDDDRLDALRVVRIGQQSKLLGVSRPTIYRMISRGELPPARRFSANVVGWSVAELKKWAATREAASDAGR